MYSKIFSQILDSSIADDPDLRHFFMDMLVLSNCHGEVNMTPTAIAARTRLPVEKVAGWLEKLSAPDRSSQSPAEEGRRIVLLDKHRDWGWKIVNYEHYHSISSQEDRRIKTAERVRRYRQRNAPVTPCNADVTHRNACNDTQTQTQTQTQTEEGAAAVLPKAPSLGDVIEYGSMHSVTDKTCRAFVKWHNDNNAWLRSGKLIDWRKKLVSWAVSDREAAQVKSEIEDTRPVWVKEGYIP